MSRVSQQSRQKACPIKCSTEVELDVDIKQKSHCEQIYKRPAAYDVELDIKIDHHCKLRPKYVKENCDPCTVGCVFTVELDFDCNSKVLHHPCQKPEARYRVDVEIEAKPKLKPIEGCKVKYYKKD